MKKITDEIYKKAKSMTVIGLASSIRQIPVFAYSKKLRQKNIVTNGHILICDETVSKSIFEKIGSAATFNEFDIPEDIKKIPHKDPFTLLAYDEEEETFILSTEKGEYEAIQTKYYKLFMSKFKSAKFFLVEKTVYQGSIVVENNGEIVGIIAKYVLSEDKKKEIDKIFKEKKE